jgi:hypothetical protein
MKKDKVFIVVTQIKSLKTKSKDSWQVTERAEFVDQIRNKHTSFATAIGDYINQKMIIGAAKGIDDYAKFELYIREKYPKQMEQLDAHFRPAAINPEVEAEAIVVDDRPVTVDGENVLVAE